SSSALETVSSSRSHTMTDGVTEPTSFPNVKGTSHTTVSSPMQLPTLHASKERIRNNVFLPCLSWISQELLLSFTITFLSKEMSWRCVLETVSRLSRLMTMDGVSDVTRLPLTMVFSHWTVWKETESPFKTRRRLDHSGSAVEFRVCTPLERILCITT
ncbi:hypothetical protein HDU99_004691, partial [Rhizoclosmatium hyalinum]